LVIVLLILATRDHDDQEKGVVEPLVYGLDRSFASLGEATINDHPYPPTIGVSSTYRSSSRCRSIKTRPSTLTPTRISTQVKLSMGQFGNINAPVSLDLPAGTPLRIRLGMDIPVSTTVSVNQTVPVSFDQPVTIKLGPARLSPVVTQLRNVVRPYVVMMQALP
jgi:hypothetical protein